MRLNKATTTHLRNGVYEANIDYIEGILHRNSDDPNI